MYLFFFLMPIPHCSSYYNFVVQFEVRKCDASNFVLSWDCFGNLGSLVVLYKFWVSFFLFFFFFPIFGKNIIGILTGIALNLQIDFGSMDILAILILPIHEHRSLFIYLCLLQFFFSKKSYSFHCTDLSFPWLNLFLGIVLFLMLL